MLTNKIFNASALGIEAYCVFLRSFLKNLSLAYFNISLSKKVAFWLRATPGVIL